MKARISSRKTLQELENQELIEYYIHAIVCVYVSSVDCEGGGGGDRVWFSMSARIAAGF